MPPATTPPAPLRSWRRLAALLDRRFVLAALGLLSAAAYLAMARLRGANGWLEVGRFLALVALLFAAYAAAAVACRRLSGGSRGAVLALLFAGAAVFRLLLVPAGLPAQRMAAGLGDDLSGRRVAFRRYLLYDQDVWRYLWDGHVAAGGFVPYGSTPNQLEARGEDGDEAAADLLAPELWQDIFANMAFRDYRTVYPPLAQLLFRGLHAAAPGSVAALKLALALLDLGTCGVLVLLLRRLGRRSEDVVLYAWNPLAIKEIAGSGHVDALMVLALTAAVYLLVSHRRAAALGTYGLAILAKLSPLVLAGAFLRRSRPRHWAVLAAVLAAGYLPFAGVFREMLQGLAAFGSQWEFNPGLWALIRWLVDAVAPGAGDPVARGVWLAGTAAAALWATVTARHESPALPARLLVVLAVHLLLAPAVMPWYALWALPLAVAAGSRAWVAATALVFLSYLAFAEVAERAWWLALEHSLIWGLLILDARRLGRTAPQPSSQPMS